MSSGDPQESILYVTSVDGSSRQVRLGPRQTSTFGRGAEVDESFPDDVQMSTRHFELRSNDGQLLLSDLGSTNGTFVNGTRIPSCSLRNHDEVVAGQTRFQVKLPTLEPSLEKQAANAPIPQTDRVSDPLSPTIHHASAPKEFSPPTSAGDLDTKTNQTANQDTSVEPSSANGSRVAPESEKLEPEHVAPSPETSDAGSIAQPSHGLNQLIIQVVGGTQFWLRPGESCIVGRSNSCGHTIDKDERLSDEHFRLECQHDGYVIRDLDSSNGTYLNDKRIRENHVCDGDIIRAGDTYFKVQIEGTVAAATRKSPVETDPFAGGIKAPRKDAKPSLITEMCGSEVMRGTATADAPDVVEMLELATRLGPIYFIVACNRIGMDLPLELSESAYLFDWLGPGAASVSPVFFAQSDVEQWKTYVEEAFGSDAVVCLVSSSPKDELAKKLRRMSRRKVSPEDTSGGLLGLCWPSVLDPLLRFGETGFAQSFMAGIDLLLVEVPGSDHWQAFSASDLATQMGNVGLVCEAKEQPLEPRVESNPKTEQAPSPADK